MKTPEEIEKVSMKSDIPPSDYSNLEIHLFLVLNETYKRYRMGQISRDQGGNLKRQAFNNYKKDKANYESYQEYIKNIKETEQLRIQLRKDKNLETALKLIELYSGEVGMWNLDHIKKSV